MNVDYDDLLISRAMEEGKAIQFTYKGTRIRITEPQKIIEHKLTMKRYLLNYQISGFSLTYSSGWKIMALESIYDVTILDIDFVFKNPKIPEWSREVAF